MSKIKKIGTARIRKISGGKKDPTTIVEDFMVRRGFDPDDCLQKRTNDIAQWLIPLNEEEDLEVTLEGLGRPAETTLYMGVNVLEVSLKELNRVLYAALVASDSLIGAKLSLVNYDLVLSVTTYTSTISTEDVDYFYELITRQKYSIREAIIDEL